MRKVIFELIALLLNHSNLITLTDPLDIAKAHLLYVQMHFKLSVSLRHS